MAIPLAAAPAIIKGIGGVVGMFKGAAARRKQQQAFAEHLEALNAQGVLTPDQYVSAYEMINSDNFEEFIPQLETALTLGDTEISNIQTDPMLRQAKMDALGRMTQLGQEGMTMTEEAAMNDIQRQMGESNRGQQEAVMQNMARRGQLGGGAEIAARMAGQGDAFDQASRGAENLAAQRNQRALQAVLESGNMASNIEGQEYARGMDLASARDAISNFNLQNKQNVGQRNVGAQNLAKSGLIDNINQSMLSNVGTRNRQADQLVEGTQAHQNALNQKNMSIANAKMGNANNQLAQSQQNIQGIQKATSGVADYAPNIISMFGKKKEDKPEGQYTQVGQAMLPGLGV